MDTPWADVPVATLPFDKRSLRVKSSCRISPRTGCGLSRGIREPYQSAHSPTPEDNNHRELPVDVIAAPPHAVLDTATPGQGGESDPDGTRTGRSAVDVEPRQVNPRRRHLEAGGRTSHKKPIGQPTPSRSGAGPLWSGWK